MTCPYCKHALTEPQIKTLWGSYTGRKQTPHAGPGAPRTKPRCKCGKMTAARAKQRNHKCSKENT